MLLDEFLPEFDVRANYSIRIRAPPDRVYASLRTADFDHWGLLRVLLGLGGLPGFRGSPASWRRLWGARRRHPVTLERVLERGFSLLGERPGEELVLGTVGRFWRARGGIWATSSERFRESSPPGTAKAAWNLGPFSGLIRREMLAAIRAAAKGDGRIGAS